MSKLAAEFQAATIKATYKLPLKHVVEIYQRPGGAIQCIWTPDVPDTSNRHVRSKVMPAYQEAMMTFMAANSEAMAKAIRANRAANR